MKKIFLLSLALLMTFTAVRAETVWPFKSKSKANSAKIERDSTKSKSKTTKYEKMFVQDKSCLTEKGKFITLHKVKSKLYFELPVKYLGRQMLLASTVSEVSDSDLGAIGYKPNPPMHIKFIKRDSTIFMSRVNISPDFDANDPNQSKAMSLTSLDPMLSSYSITCYTPDSSAVILDVTSMFVGSYEPLTPMSKSGGMLNIKGTFNSQGAALAEIKSFDDNITIKSYLSYTVTVDMMGLFLLMQNEPVTMKVTRTLLLLPEQKMRPRVSDARVGTFITFKSAMNSDRDGIKPYSVVNRWDLQPKDTAAYLRGELVEPVKPIVYYLDDAFPELWREPAKEGVLRWNKAFEKIGFKNAIQVVDFPKNDPEFDPDNLKYSCIRYVPAQVSNAMGPSWVDPSTGEIINASVIVYNDVIKLLNSWRFVQTGQIDESVRAKKLPDHIVKESIAYILAHEVGHTLGFMHNMAASAAYSVDSLRSASFTQKYGTTSSIMDYARFNYVAQPQDKGVKLTPPDLGVYDDYIVKYAYKPIIDAKTTLEEQPTLESWVDEKAGDIKYRYGVQQSAKYRYDPSAIEEDLGDDPIKAAEYGIKNLKYLLANLNNWFPNDVDPDGSHRQLQYENIAQQYDRYLKAVLLNVGGIYLTQVKPGTKGETVSSVPKERQRAALLWSINQMKNCQWLVDKSITDQFGLRVSLEPIFKYYTALEVYATYSNVILSSHVADKNPYTVKEYFDDLYGSIWESAIKGRPVNQTDRILQKLYLTNSTDIASKKSQLVKVGLTSLDNSHAASVGQISAFGLDETGTVDKYLDQLRELEAVKGKGYIADKLDVNFGSGYNMQYRVNLRSIDESKSDFFNENLRILKLLKSRVASSTGETKDHYQMMIFMIEDSLKSK